jgi:hypothetical protein
MPNKRLVNSGNRVLSLVYLFLKFYCVNLKIEVVKLYVYVYRSLICMQVWYIFLYALNLTQYFTDVCCIIVGCRDS